MILEQQRLDVLTKKRSNLFNWRGQFTPEFVEYILESFTNEGDKILDPFSGSGTVLLESARRNLEAIGYEINPSAYAMSKFFTFCNMPLPERKEFSDIFESKLNLQLQSLNGQKIFNETDDYRESYSNLLKCAKNFNKTISTKNERILWLNILFQSEKDKKLTVKDSIKKSFLSLKSSLLNIPFSSKPVTVRLADAKSVNENLKEQVDLIFTSPPYINVFNYHQNYRAIIEAFQFDILKVAHSEFGSNRKNRGNRFKTVIQYCLDMEIALNSFWQALKPNGKIVLVVGRESNVRSIPFYNGRLVIEILKQSNGFKNIQTLERQFTNKFGLCIKEDIIIAEKTKILPICFSYGKLIALEHLKEGLKKAVNNVKFDINDAIQNINSVVPSPLFNPKNIITND